MKICGVYRYKSTECSTWTKSTILAPTVFGQCCQHKFEISKRLDISLYLLNHLYNYNNPKILAPVSESVEGVASEIIAISQSDTTRGMKQVEIPEPVHKSPGFQLRPSFCATVPVLFRDMMHNQVPKYLRLCTYKVTSYYQFTTIMWYDYVHVLQINNSKPQMHT